MKPRGIIVSTVVFSVLTLLLTGCPQPPYEPEFWVDSHGAAGVAMFLG